MWRKDGPQGFESRKIRNLLPRYTRGRVLDIGCGQEKAFPHFIGVDNGHHFGRGAANVVCDANNLNIFASESFDAIFSSHTLEHMVDPLVTLKEWWRLIKVGGFLVLYLPHKEFYPNVGQDGANPDHKHDFVPGDIVEYMKEVGEFWALRECEDRNQGDEYSFFMVFEKKDCCGQQTTVPVFPKRACVCRFGGFGDMLQAASVLPRLAEEGFHITFMTTPKGKDILEHDPHIKDWYIVDKDQIPNGALPDFWEEQATRFDRFVQLSESVEGTLLALPGRTNHAWPHPVRHAMLNINYMEMTCVLGGTKFEPCRLFYPSDQERQRVMETHIKSGGRFNIVWALAGSSIHKFYPYMDSVIAQIMVELPDAHVFMVGDDACKLLEQGWEEEPRVHRLSGEMSIRDTLTLAELSDCVVGPETGVLNSVAYLPGVDKVIMLSHSSHENLTKHWLSTEVILPDDDTECYPCHQLHYGNKYCKCDVDTGAALCACNTDPSKVYKAIYESYQRRAR